MRLRQTHCIFGINCGPSQEIILCYFTAVPKKEGGTVLAGGILKTFTDMPIELVPAIDLIDGKSASTWRS